MFIYWSAVRIPFSSVVKSLSKSELHQPFIVTANEIVDRCSSIFETLRETFKDTDHLRAFELQTGAGRLILILRLMSCCIIGPLYMIQERELELNSKTDGQVKTISFYQMITIARYIIYTQITPKSSNINQ